MQSGGFLRTVIVAVLFVALVCDYSTLIMQIYQTVRSGNETSSSQSLFSDSEDSYSLKRGAPAFREDKADLDLDADIDFGKINAFGGQSRGQMVDTIKNACLPKLICELSASSNTRTLTENESSLLQLISDTSIGTIAEVTSKYHFAAHMGQLVSGMDGMGCHSFYTSCPLAGSSILSMMKKIRMR